MIGAVVLEVYEYGEGVASATRALEIDSPWVGWRLGWNCRQAVTTDGRSREIVRGWRRWGRASRIDPWGLAGSLGAGHRGHGPGGLRGGGGRRNAGQRRLCGLRC